MTISGILVWIVRILRARFAAAIDALPPYRNVHGLLMAKDVSPDGLYYVTVADQRVEIDWLTYDTLVIGENLRIRATRSYIAINIDRVVS